MQSNQGSQESCIVEHLGYCASSSSQVDYGKDNICAITFGLGAMSWHWIIKLPPCTFSFKISPWRNLKAFPWKFSTPQKPRVPGKSVSLFLLKDKTWSFQLMHGGTSAQCCPAIIFIVEIQNCMCIWFCCKYFATSTF